MSSFRNSTVYQIYIKSFCDSNGDGIGDLNGIRSRLDYLKSLGIDYIWITPFFKSPMNDNGYDVADYYSVNPMFGTMEDAEALIREADESAASALCSTWSSTTRPPSTSGFRRHWRVIPSTWITIFSGIPWTDTPLRTGFPSSAEMRGSTSLLCQNITCTFSTSPRRTSTGRIRR